MSDYETSWTSGVHCVEHDKAFCNTCRPNKDLKYVYTPPAVSAITPTRTAMRSSQAERKPESGASRFTQPATSDSSMRSRKDGGRAWCAVASCRTGFREPIRDTLELPR